MGETILYYDCFAGISGDMNLAALLDLGVPEEHLRAELGKLGVHGYELRRSREQRRAVTGTRVEVVLETDHHHGGAGQDAHAHGEHQGAGHAHAHRGLSDIRAIIDKSTLPDRVKERSSAIFSTLARAEAKVHGIGVEEVHFHEVGGVDAIVDIVGAAICLEWIGANQIWCGPVELGSGMVRCAHGVFPVPAPATAEILSSRGVPVTTGRSPFEATTPTGAAILATCVDRFVHRAELVIERTGYGLGSREMETPNALRLFLGSTAQSSAMPEEDVTEEQGVLVECTIDDMPAEAFGAVMDELFAVGARDVTFSPVVMKKSRPGTTISVLCTDTESQVVRRVLFTHTTTIGLRQQVVRKFTLRREEERVDLDGSSVRVKHAYFDGRLVRSKPEHDDCRRVAAERGESVQEVADRVRRIVAERRR